MKSEMTWGDWQKEIVRLREKLETDPENLETAKDFWSCINGKYGFNCASGRWVIEAFRSSAMVTVEGLRLLAGAFRNLSEVSGELPTRDRVDGELLSRIVSSEDTHEDISWLKEILK